MDHGSERLAGFLRARRALVSPMDVGLSAVASDTRRRVEGLRREELAMLAGVSADYYVRLEQGRGHVPSDSVLSALARALQLDEHLTTHLFALARPEARMPRTSERVSDRMQDLLDAWTTTPATVTSRRMNVVAANALACELAPCYLPGTNLLRSLFLERSSRDTHANWHASAAEAVANFRARIGTADDDPELSRLVGDLSLHSQEFRELWARHDVHTTTEGRKGFVHPEVGRVTLDYHAMPVGDGQVMTVLHARPGTADQRALTLLASLVAG